MSAEVTYREIADAKPIITRDFVAVGMLIHARWLVKDIPYKQLRPDIRFILRIARKHNLPDTTPILMTPEHWEFM